MCLRLDLKECKQGAILLFKENYGRNFGLVRVLGITFKPT